MFDRPRVLADEFVLFDVVGFLPDRLHCQGQDVTPMQGTALIILAAAEFRFRVEMVADKAAAKRLQPDAGIGEPAILECDRFPVAGRNVRRPTP
jgi:hypothetical protein